jgi:hypothetical protein
MRGMNLSIERPNVIDPENRSAGWPEQNGGKSLFGEGGPSFGDLLDTINPLQHLPIVGTIYRALTGDSLSDGARLAGGALYGGPVGLVAAMAGIGYEQATGRGLEETALAALRGEEAPAATAPAVALAAAPPPPADAPPASARLASLAPAAGPAATPQLSPEAFDALMRSVNQKPAAAPSGRPLAWSRPNPASAPVDMPPAVRAAARGGLPQVSPVALDALSPVAGVPAPGARQASLELHDALRQFAQQKGRAAAP